MKLQASLASELEKTQQDKLDAEKRVGNKWFGFVTRAFNFLIYYAFE